MKAKQVLILSVVIIIIAVLVPISLVLVAFCAPPQFNETYYGELAHMFRRLKQTEGKKIVLIGNSSLAFGVRTDLMEAEFPGYSVVNFGLYGAIGTKVMLDLSRVNIGEGDIVIVAPERNEQAQSLYFSADETWMAMDGEFSMLARLKRENAGAMAGKFLGFLSKKYGYIYDGKKPVVEGVYTQAAFNDETGAEVGYMTYEREYNKMVGGYDANNPVDFSEEVSEDFLDYLNEYNNFVAERGASLYYGFTPVNSSAVTDCGKDTIDAYYDRLRDSLGFRLLGDPNSYLMDHNWFYDTNFHVNSAGMYVYTDRLTDDIKAELGIETPNQIVIPEKPSGGSPSVPPTGENNDGECFIYENFADGIKITGLTEAGRSKTSFVIPASYNGKAVICFDPSVFAGNTTVEEITLQKSCLYIYNYSFAGCTALRRIVLEHDNPNTIGVGMSLLDGAENCKIYIKKNVYDMFATHYNWSMYRDELVAY